MKLLPPYRIHYLPMCLHPTIEHMHTLGGQKGGKSMEVKCKWGGNVAAKTERGGNRP